MFEKKSTKQENSSQNIKSNKERQEDNWITVHLGLWNLFSVHNLAVCCQCCFWVHRNVGENKDHFQNSSPSRQDCFNCQVAMTYSVELFICIVVGLVLGHAIFNSSMHLFNRKLENRSRLLCPRQALRWERAWILAAPRKPSRPVRSKRGTSTCRSYNYCYTSPVQHTCQMLDQVQRHFPTF